MIKGFFLNYLRFTEIKFAQISAAKKPRCDALMKN